MRSITSVRVGIIGTGFAGIAAAIELKRHGHDDIVIFERAQDVGGVWRENTYPGAACDVPSPYYSFSFEPNPGWPRRFAPQGAILEYLRDVTDAYDVRRHIRFGSEVTGAAFDGTSGTWTVHTKDGGAAEVDVLVPAVGQLSRPSWPAIAGREHYQGTMFHSAEWDHSADLAGKRVAVIGTGASAVQFVPEIQPSVSRLTLFQRTPPYVLPRPDTEFTERHRQLFNRLPVTQRLERAGWYGVTEALGVALLHARPLASLVAGQARWHMKRQTAAVPGLFEKIWPTYPIGCKRILFSSDYLPALTRPNVDVVTDGIREITSTGIRTADGVDHQVDVIIFGTGFTATDFLAPLTITGLGGRDLRSEWSEGARAHLGINVPHFPNMFLMYGPNTNLGSGSVVAMLEAQATYIARAVAHVVRSGAAIAVRPEVENQYDAEIQASLVDGVWSRCSSWYRLPNGRIPTNWPGTVTAYRRRTATFAPDDFEPVTASDIPLAAPYS